MLRPIQRAWHRFIGATEWQAQGRSDGRFVWRRRDPDTLAWDERAMTEDEEHEAAIMWAIR